MIFGKTNYVVGESLSMFQSNKNQKREKAVKFNELRNSVLNILEERRIVVFYDR